MMSVGFCTGFSLKQQVLHQLIFSHEDTPDNTHNAGLTLKNILGDFKSLWALSGIAEISFNAAMGIDIKHDSLILQVRKAFKKVLGEQWFDSLCSQPELTPQAVRGSVLEFFSHNYKLNYITFWEEVAHAADLQMPNGIRGMSVGELKSELNQWMRDHRGRIQQITRFVLSNSDLLYLPEEIGLLSNLEELFLGNNNLKFLPESIGTLVNLNTLILDRNKLSSLPASFRQLQRLALLSLGSNKFAFFPEPITSLRALQYLILSDNLLSNLPISIKGLVNLEELILAENKLSSLPATLKELTRLQLLDLSNETHESPDSPTLSEELMESFLEVLKSLDHLQNLNLRNTNITPSRELISQFQNLRNLILDPAQSDTFRGVMTDLRFAVGIECGEVGDFIVFCKQEAE